MTHTQTFSTRSIRTFAQEHDHLPSFHAAYLVLTILSAALFNFGFFAMLIAIHMALDVYKYRECHRLSWYKTIEGMIRESLIDMSLLMMGLVVAVYLHPSLTGLAGIKGMMLAELTVLRGVGVITPKIKVLYTLLKILKHLEHYLEGIHPRMGKKASLVEVVCLLSILVCIGMLIGAPILLSLSGQQYAFILLGELIPWKL